MHTFAAVLFEKVRKSEVQAERERIRRVRLAKAAHPRAQRRWRVRYMALWLGDMASGVRCRLRRRFAVGLS
jgi:hypothetical protein